MTQLLLWTIFLLCFCLKIIAIGIGIKLDGKLLENTPEKSNKMFKNVRE